MQNRELFEKYLQGRHWEEHPTVYAELFSDILLREGAARCRIVDVGCGTGRDVAEFSKREFDVLGIDYSEDEIANARSLHPSCAFDVQDAERLVIRDSAMDAAFSINVMHYVDQARTVSEIHRVLRPGGLFFVHFNLRISDRDGNVDLEQDEKKIMELFHGWQAVDRQVYDRIDTKPFDHVHTILQLVLRRE